MFETGYFSTNVYKALQTFLVFLTNVPKLKHKRTHQNTLNTRFIEHGKNIAINVKRTKFSEAVKPLLTFPTCETAMAVTVQPIVNCCIEVFLLVNYLYLVIVDDTIRLGWRVFPKINAHGFCCGQAHIRSITPCNKVV